MARLHASVAGGIALALLAACSAASTREPASSGVASPTAQRGQALVTAAPAAPAEPATLAPLTPAPAEPATLAAFTPAPPEPAPATPTLAASPEGAPASSLAVASSRTLVADERLLDFQLVPGTDLLVYRTQVGGGGSRFATLSLDGTGGRELATVPGDITDYAVGSDGRWVLAYGSGGIVAVPIAGGPLRRLAELPTGADRLVCPQFSPDGRWLVYGVGLPEQPTPTPPLSHGPYFRALYSVSAELGPVELRAPGEGLGANCQVVVSPDSRWVGSLVGDIPQQEFGGGHLQFAPIGGGEPGSYGPAAWAAFTADSSLLLFAGFPSDGPEVELFGVPTGGGAPARIAPPPGEGWEPLPYGAIGLRYDGAWVIYTRAANGPGLVALDPQGGAQLRLGLPPGGATEGLQISPDAAWFVFVTDAPDALQSAPATGGAAQTLYTPAGQEWLMPMPGPRPASAVTRSAYRRTTGVALSSPMSLLTPDSQHVIFSVHNTSETGTGFPKLLSAPVGGGGLVDLSASAGLPYTHDSAEITADGRWVLFLGHTPGVFGVSGPSDVLFAAPPAGGPALRLSDPGRTVTRFQPTADGRRVVAIAAIPGDAPPSEGGVGDLVVVELTP